MYQIYIAQLIFIYLNEEKKENFFYIIVILHNYLFDGFLQMYTKKKNISINSTYYTYFFFYILN